MASEKQIETNRANGHKAAGKARDTSRSRLNAINHGLLATGVTEIDDSAGHFTLLKQLQEQCEPVGEIENFLVERIALSITRVRRSVRFESEAITAALHPERRSKSRLDEEMERQFAQIGAETSTIDPGFQCQFANEVLESLAQIIGRYETLHEKRLFRAIQELEHMQTARKSLRQRALPAAVTPTGTS